MKKLTENEIRQIQLNILCFLHNVCEENGLRYYLCGGSLIGAVRHNGFIPWDDDIDVDMPREDYMRLKKIISSNNKYRLLTYESSTNYNLAFGKLIDCNTSIIENNNPEESVEWGIYVDIFPIDGLPKNYYKLYFNALVRLNEFILIGTRKTLPWSAGIVKSLKNRTKHRITKVIGVKRLKKLLLSLSQKYLFENSEMVCCIGGGYGRKELYPRHYFDKRILADFAGKKYYIPAEYDAFLTQMYGDYMKLPPKEDRIAHHSIEAYIRNDTDEEVL